MRNAVIGFFMIIVLVLSGAAIHTAESKTMKKNELDTSLGAAMEQSMRLLNEEGIYSVNKENGSEEFTADFIENFLMKTTSSSEFIIEILAVDVERGLLDVRASQVYPQIIGEGKVSCRKTVLLEDYDNPQNTYYEVSFSIEGKNQEEKNVIKAVNVYGGDYLNKAVLPQNGVEKEGSTLTGWRLVQPQSQQNIIYSAENIQNICVMQNLEFQAVYQKAGRK